MAAGTPAPPTPFAYLGKRLGIDGAGGRRTEGGHPGRAGALLQRPCRDVVVVAFAAVIGHTFSIFLKGRGGKGVATGAGAAIAMIPLPMACLIGLFHRASR